MAKGASAIAKEDKKVKSQDNDLLCPEPMEGKEQKSVWGFEQKQKTSVEVLQEIKLEASVRNLAYGGLELS